MQKYRGKTLLIISGIVLSLSALLLLLIAGPGHRFGVWGFRFGFALFKWAAYLGVLGLISSVIGFFSSIKGPKKALLLAALGAAAGLISFYTPWHLWTEAKKLPAIHDITTDTAAPPEFEAVKKIRDASHNTVTYDAQNASLQKRFYPDVKPVILPMDAKAAFNRSLETAREMGWEIISAEEGKGRIEAVDTTLWFGFKDDIVIRLTPMDGGGTKADVRSLSRVGRGDAGKNAERIMDFTELLRKD